jgi:uncharacterized protein (TIGR00725 family)
VKLTVAVIGKNEQHAGDPVDAAVKAAAEAVGRLIAERGGVVVTGGRRGVMEAASKGARAAGGLTIGFLPSADKADANPYVDVVFPTGLGRARNLLVARACDALMMIGGEAGTLNELTIAYAEARPIVVLEGSGGWADKLRGVMHHGRFLDERAIVEIHFAATPEDAVTMAFALASDPARAARPDRP